MSKIPVIAVCGATASGKTALAVEIAIAVGGEVVSADSMQIYKYMDIGSAKPDMAERKGVIHHMMDIIEPTVRFSVADYAAAAHEIIADIYKRGKIPVLAGGTGLYINSVIDDATFSENDTDESLRQQLFDIAKEKDEQYLHDMLREIDPDAADVIHPNNVKRVVRAIEFCRMNNKLFSKHAEEDKKRESRYLPLMLDISWDRDALYERINKRVDIMYEQGLVEEVKKLLEMGCNETMTAMQGIGYKETVRYIKGECTLFEAMEEVKLATRRYAKRQLTWFRRDERIMHLVPENAVSDGIRIAKEFKERNGF